MDQEGGQRRGLMFAFWIATCWFLGSAGAGAAPGCQKSGTGACVRQLAGVATLYRRSKTWSDYVQPVVVLQFGQVASALHFVPGTRAPAPPRFLAIGDAAGGLHLLSPVTGRLLGQHDTGTSSPVTALGSYCLGFNTTVLLTGHASGELRLHSLVHPRQQNSQEEQGKEDEWRGSGDTVPPLSLALLIAFPPSAVLCGMTLADDAGRSSEQQQGERHQQHTCAATVAAGCSPIVAVHGIGRGGGVASMALLYDGTGRLAVLKHGGPAIQDARLVRQVTLGQHPVALRLSSISATLLGSSGIAGQRLSLPPAPHSGKTQKPAAAAAAAAGEGPLEFKPCSGLNGTSIVAAAFDQQHPSRAYALADDGRMLTLVVGGEKSTQAGCQVRAASAQALPAGLLQGPPPCGSSEQQQQQPGAGAGAVVTLAWIPGYLLATAGTELDRLLLVFNVTAAPRAPPQRLLCVQLTALRDQFGIHSAAAEQLAQQGGQWAGGAALLDRPLSLAASREGHVALMLNSTVLALYETAFPYHAPSIAPLESMAWLQMLHPFAMALVAGLVIYRARSRRDGGDGDGGGAGLLGKARLRELERLLQDPMAGVSRSRPSPGSGGFQGGYGGSDNDSGSDQEDSSLMGHLHRMEGSGSLHHKRQSLFGRKGGTDGIGGTRDRAQVARLRAFSLAASDDRETVAAALVGRGAPGGQTPDSSGEEVEEEEEELNAWEQLQGGGAGCCIWDRHQHPLQHGSRPRPVAAAPPPRPNPHLLNRRLQLDAAAPMCNLCTVLQRYRGSLSQCMSAATLQHRATVKSDVPGGQGASAGHSVSWDCRCYSADASVNNC